jgi:hypothetical protein
MKMETNRYSPELAIEMLAKRSMQRFFAIFSLHKPFFKMKLPQIVAKRSSLQT